MKYYAYKSLPVSDVSGINNLWLDRRVKKKFDIGAGD